MLHQIFDSHQLSAAPAMEGNPSEGTERESRSGTEIYAKEDAIEWNRATD